MRFKNRREAGRTLAEQLQDYAGRSDVVVLALPRGGLPVAFEVAAALGAPLDVFLVRKLGVPGHPELAMGAIAEGGVRVLNDELVAMLGLPESIIDQVAVRERLELERRQRLYRGDRPSPTVRDRIAILIDDGLATGATMEAAVLALRQQKPAGIIVAAPVGAQETCERLRSVADTVVCADTPEPFSAVGLWYEDFAQTTDEEVRQLLAAAGRVIDRPDSTRNETSRGETPRRNGRQRERIDEAADLVWHRAYRLTGDASQYDPLLDLIGDARLVLLGESSHGTHEFYAERAAITRRLIEERGFAGVAVEADWPDAYRVNRYVRGASTDEDSEQALSDFKRFPTWMWRNTAVLELVRWLRAHNDMRAADERAGFYGLDLYSLHASTQAVIAYLDNVDPDAARRARERYGCFDHFGEELQQYAYATAFGMSPSCEREVLTQLMDLNRRAGEYARRDGRVAADELFFAEQNARLVKNAEAYYRVMMLGRAESWNLRDRHMFDTLKELLQYLDGSRPGARLVVWAHNSHLGDARATEMGEGGELNVGQLARERFGASAVLVGFTTFSGTVTAASDWDGPTQRKQVRPALPGSYERLFHEARVRNLLVPLRTDPDLASALHPRRLERAIGVIYRPDTERRSHYFHARLADQFDAVLHFDETRAVEPIDRTSMWEAGEIAETYPFGV